jgi:two-component system sensor histidine kinase DesK
MTLLGWWRERGQAARFDYYVRASFYVNFAVLPVLAVVGVSAELGAGVWLVGPLFGAHALCCAMLTRAGLDSYLGRRPRPARLMAAAVALTIGGAAAGYLLLPGGAPGNAATTVLMMLSISLVVAISTAVRLSVTLVTVVVTCAVLSALVAVQGGAPAGAAVAFAAVLVAVTFAGRSSAWMLGVVWELDRARHVQASLAVAEERLRFARDLHDVVGRTLSVVALKSELAAQLARRGRETAIDEMLEVHRIAEESLAEMRAVVGGYRAADLDAELAGARSLLASAGIECRMIGDGSRLPAAVQSTLGWAVREGTTNVLRHSDARTCTITLRVAAGGEVSLTMENDGVRDTGAADARVRFDSGLVGLAERLTPLNGTVTAERHGPDRFRLDVILPPGDAATSTPAAADGVRA